MNNTLKKLIVGGALMLTLTAGGLGVYALTTDTLATRAAIESAISAKDLTAYKQALINHATERGNNTTQEQLNTMADRKTAMDAHRSAVETAVKNNDFDAFKQAHANRPAKPTQDGETRPEPTEAQLKERFDAMVTYYQKNGSLPEHKKGFGKRLDK